MLNRLYHKILDIEPERISQIVTTTVVIVLLLLIMPQLLTVFSAINHQSEYSSSSTTKLKKTPDYNTRSITTSHLFGTNALAGATANQLNLPETRLQLQLHGAFSSSNPSLASAIIQGPDGDSRSYKINSRIYGQAMLHQVFNDRVVLSRDGQLETLYFPEPGTEINAASKTSNTVAGNNLDNYAIPADIKQLVQDNMSVAEIQQASKQLRSSALTPKQREQLIRKRLQELRNRAKNKK